MIGEAVAEVGTPAPRGGKPVLVLRKARQVIDSFTPAQPELTAREVQHRTGLPSTTCQRLLQSLVEEGFLDRRDGRYRPGLALLRWAGAASAGRDLISTAMPVLVRLRDATGETACLYLRDGRQHVCVAVVQTAHAVAHILRVGQALPLHAGSAGRVFLAYDEGAAAQIEQQPLEAYTQHTLTNWSALSAAVDDTRRTGHAVSFEERAIGAGSISAPVFDHTGSIVAAIGIVSPIQRFNPERKPVFVPHVILAGAELSHCLGQAVKGEDLG